MVKIKNVKKLLFSFTVMFFLFMQVVFICAEDYDPKTTLRFLYSGPTDYGEGSVFFGPIGWPGGCNDAIPGRFFDVAATPFCGAKIESWLHFYCGDGGSIPGNDWRIGSHAYKIYLALPYCKPAKPRPPGPPPCTGDACCMLGGGGPGGGGPNGEGNPILPAFGSKYEESKDISFKNPGHDLDFIRVYDSNTVSEQPISKIGNLGRGWRCNYDYSIAERTVESYIIADDGNQELHWVEIDGAAVPEKKYYADLTFPDGGKYVFESFDNKQTFKKAGKPWIVYRNGDGSYKAKIYEKIYLFDPAGRLTAMTDEAGKGVFLTYFTDSVEITDGFGRKIVLTLSGGYIVSVGLANVSGYLPYVYEYISGNLHTVKRNDKIEASYDYTSNYMTRQIDYRKTGIYKDETYELEDPNNYKYRYTREMSTGNIEILSLVYNADKTVTATDKSGTRTITYNANGDITAINHGYRGIETREYDSNDNLKKLTLQNGTVKENFYDENGMKWKTTTTWSDPLVSSRSSEEKYEYNSNGEMTKYTDARNVETRYEYENSRVKHVFTAGKTVDYDYYSDGNIKTIHDSERGSKTYTYDSYGNATQIKNNITGLSQFYTYYNSSASYGRVFEHTDETGLKKTYTYDADFPDSPHTIVMSKDSVQETTTYSYETGENAARGNVKTVTDIMGEVVYNYNINTGLLTSQEDKATGVRSYTYDNYGRMKTATDNEQGSRTYNYDPEYGLLNSTIDSLGKSTSYQYDNEGNRTSVTDRNQKPTTYQYDGLNRLRLTHDANSADVKYDYDVNGNRTQIVDGENNVTTYEYNSLNRLTHERYADSSYIKYEYSQEGDLKKRQVYTKTNTLEKDQSFSYDNAHRITNDGIYTYSYGASGCSCSNRLSAVTGPNGQVLYEYDLKGRVNKTTVNGTDVIKEYNDAQKKRTVKIGTQELFVVNVDGEGRAVSVVDKLTGGDKTFAIQRDDVGRVTQVDYPNQNKSVTMYDTEGRILTHKNFFKDKLLNKFLYNKSGYLDGEGNKMKEDTNTGTKNYGYDNIYQLTTAEYEKSQQSFTWTYDDAGNRLASTEDTVQKTYSPNNLNQYTTVNSTTYTYDADGNLLSDGTRAYTWDVKNRLTQVVTGGKTITYKYDHNDWRVEKTVDGVTTKYLYDGNLLLAETDNAGKIQKVYINDGQGIVGMVRYIYKADGTLSHYQPLYYIFDSLGSVSLITSEDGKPLQNYKYTPYGASMNTESDTVNALRFVGRYGGYQDDDTNLTYFWHRWYDGGDGRWVSRDPIGVREGPNVYKYVNNYPVKWIDLNGLCGASGGWDAMSGASGDWSYNDVTIRYNYCGKNYSEGILHRSWREENSFETTPMNVADSCCREHDRCSHFVLTQMYDHKLAPCKYRTKTITDCNKELADCFGNSGGDIYSFIGRGIFGFISPNLGNPSNASY